MSNTNLTVLINNAALLLNEGVRLAEAGDITRGLGEQHAARAVLLLAENAVPMTHAKATRTFEVAALAGAYRGIYQHDKDARETSRWFVYAISDMLAPRPDKSGEVTSENSEAERVMRAKRAMIDRGFSLAALLYQCEVSSDAFNKNTGFNLEARYFVPKGCTMFAIVHGKVTNTVASEAAAVIVPINGKARITYAKPTKSGQALVNTTSSVAALRAAHNLAQPTKAKNVKSLIDALEYIASLENTALAGLTGDAYQTFMKAQAVMLTIANKSAELQAAAKTA